MRSARGILVLLMGLLTLAVLSGCTSYREDRSHGPGDRISEKSFKIWPIFEAEHEVYTEATHDEGDFLLFISWSRWHELPAPRPEACPVPAAVEPKAPPAETPESSEKKPEESPT